MRYSSATVKQREREVINIFVNLISHGRSHLLLTLICPFCHFDAFLRKLIRFIFCYMFVWYEISWRLFLSNVWHIFLTFSIATYVAGVVNICYKKDFVCQYHLKCPLQCPYIYYKKKMFQIKFILFFLKGRLINLSLDIFPRFLFNEIMCFHDEFIDPSYVNKIA